MDTLENTYDLQRKMLLRADRDDIKNLTPETRAELVLEYLGHLQEELVELRQELPRRFWRNDEVNPFETDRTKFDDELVDCWLLLRALTAVSGITKDSDLEVLIARKTEYNKIRSDHKGNQADE